MKSGTSPCLFRAGCLSNSLRATCGISGAKRPYTSQDARFPALRKSSYCAHFSMSCCVRKPSQGSVAAEAISIQLEPGSCNRLSYQIFTCRARKAKETTRNFSKLTLAQPVIV